MTRNTQRNMPALALATTFTLLSSAAMAQKPTETQMLNNADTQNRETVDARAVHKDQKAYFKSIDIGNKGYLTSDDVAADAFLQKNYPKCDVDHDGKLTWAEFKDCTRNNAAASGG